MRFPNPKFTPSFCRGLSPCLALLLLTTSTFASPKPIHLKLESQPPHPVNGAACIFKVTATGRLSALHGKWLDHDVEFTPLETGPTNGQTNGRTRGSTWVGIAGTSFATTKGQYPLSIEGKSADGSLVRFEQKIRVAIVKRKIIAAPKPLTVEGKFTSPDAKTLKRIDEEKALKAATYKKTSPDALWSGEFIRPLDSVITEEFGVRRMFNSQLLSEHHGVDFRAAPGTAVLAANSGRVVLARDLFFEGNCVMLDHGQGLISIYMHFSKLTVQEGDQVERGQKLGESGATGRVTGPHLHVSVQWRGIPLDLLSLTALKPPELNQSLN